eukprot:TRINITY_DN7620_c2_g1_i2.p2 TRINITY_DN7620_c2_g1~~TRINITY_DN7620_c2_g1_i2.p2  ORF type:complete len:115 (+),score=8.77 TRINITY_DN7620_c2_g1_i2:444-788(+)
MWHVFCSLEPCYTRHQSLATLRTFSAPRVSSCNDAAYCNMAQPACYPSAQIPPRISSGMTLDLFSYDPPWVTAQRETGLYRVIFEICAQLMMKLQNKEANQRHWSPSLIRTSRN